jgi:glycosyltransferase involved in cell wall biosynthesis
MVDVSVVIPSYNCGAWLAESLDSMLAQADETVEVIVIDDGSTDDTRQVLAGYRDRVTVVQGDHRGLAAARNLGLSRARGAWIAFHDADDVALPRRLPFQRAFLAAHPDVDAIFCNGERMDDPARRMVPADIVRDVAGRALTVSHLFAGYPVYFQGALVARAAFDRAGPFDETFRVQPEIEYGYRFFPRCRAMFVDEVVFRYRWHTTNTSRDLLGTRVDIARTLEDVLVRDPHLVDEIGGQRFRARLARHHFRIACSRLKQGDAAGAGVEARRATALYPLHPRYQLLRMRCALSQ